MHTVSQLAAASQTWWKCRQCCGHTPQGCAGAPRIGLSRGGRPAAGRSACRGRGLCCCSGDVVENVEIQTPWGSAQSAKNNKCPAEFHQQLKPIRSQYNRKIHQNPITNDFKTHQRKKNILGLIFFTIFEKFKMFGGPKKLPPRHLFGRFFDGFPPNRLRSLFPGPNPPNSSIFSFFFWHFSEFFSSDFAFRPTLLLLLILIPPIIIP